MLDLITDPFQIDNNLQAEINQAVAACLSLTNKTGLLVIKFVELTEIQELNKQYRDKNKPTNVLTFPNNLPIYNKNAPIFLGDVLICIPKVEQEANDQAKSFREHLLHICIHGTLHALGFDHEALDEAKIMENLEIQILKQFKISDPYLVTGEKI